MAIYFVFATKTMNQKDAWIQQDCFFNKVPRKVAFQNNQTLCFFFINLQQEAHTFNQLAFPITNYLNWLAYRSYQSEALQVKRTAAIIRKVIAKG